MKAVRQWQVLATVPTADGLKHVQGRIFLSARTAEQHAAQLRLTVMPHGKVGARVQLVLPL
jgi:hypothetical protein